MTPVLEFEIPARSPIAFWSIGTRLPPQVIGKRPDAVFVTFTGKPRTQEAIKVAIEKAVLRHLGVKITPHQFRHWRPKSSSTTTQAPTSWYGSC